MGFWAGPECSQGPQGRHTSKGREKHWTGVAIGAYHPPFWEPGRGAASPQVGDEAGDGDVWGTSLESLST